MRRTPAAILCAVVALAGCSAFSDADAVQLVRDYNRRVVQAFRAGDASLVDAVTGPTDGKRLTGLIGVKLDQGITLDAELLALAPLRIDRAGREVVVHTEERWTYRNRRIGSGAQIGPESTDHYFVAYHLARLDGRWVVDHIDFDRPPEVGRRIEVATDPRAMHGVQTLDAGAAPRAPSGAWTPPRFGGER